MATNTYVALDKVTANGSVSSITFSAIPQTYTDLVIVSSVKMSSAGTNLAAQVNGNTGTNYSTTFLVGSGSSVGSTRYSNQTAMTLDNYGYPDTSIFNLNIATFFNYSSSSVAKTTLVRCNNTNTGLSAITNLWRGSTGSSTEAITSITISANNNYAAGSTFSLYGVAGEGITPAPKATGGVIYSDSTYYYHVFPSTGVFTPNQALSADIMTIAGGGGGGCEGAGGGGAGGFRVLTSQSLTNAVAYTCTVGGGGAGSGSNSFRGFKGTNTTFAGSGFTTISSTGGGGGGSASVAIYSGQAGGSGGGARSNVNAAGGAGNEGGYSPVEGYAGATTTGSSTVGAGGGGGAGGVGTLGDGTITKAGAGGPGNSSYLSWATATGTGVNGVYAGGGGGAINESASASQIGLGSAGGGNGGGQTFNATAAIANTGSGGGGGGGFSGYLDGAAGGSGLVIVRYAKA